MCMRCVRAERTCDGYFASFDDNALDSTVVPLFVEAAPQPFSLPPTGTRDDSCILIALECLRSRDTDHGGASPPLWDGSLPQLMTQYPVVRQALGYLGAAIEAESSFSSTSSPAYRSAVMRYDTALRSLRTGMSARGIAPAALVLSGLLLAFGEIVQWREANALTHVHGAITNWERCMGSEAWDPSYNTSVNTSDHDSAITIEVTRQLDLFALNTDIVTASFMLGVPVRMHVAKVQSLLRRLTAGDDHRRVVVKVLAAIHAVHTVLPKVLEYKYLPAAALPENVGAEQEKVLAELHGCLQDLNIVINAAYDALDRTNISPSIITACTLRAQCLSAKICLSAASLAYETTYDAFFPDFHQIVKDASYVLSERTPRTTPFEPFIPDLGILQPLLMTALKCRDPNIRRQAVPMLATGGREGPFHGRVLAAAAARIIQVENGGLALDCAVRRPPVIPENRRVHGMGVDLDNLAQRRKRSVQVILSQCRNVKYMLESEAEWTDDVHWNIWSEEVPI
jgi:hypothetical protein